MQETKSGFTLVELLVSMAVVAILASSLALVNVSKNLSRARDNRRQTDLELLRSALEQYRYDNGKYITGNLASLSALVPNYIGTIPADPKSGYTYYYVSAAGTSYQLCSRLENTAAATVCGASSPSCGTGGNCNYQVVNP